jgi:hypothetical protein
MANKNLGLELGSIESTTSLEPASNGLFWFLQKDGSRVYIVLGETINTTDTSIIATAGIPQIGDVVDGAPVRRHKAKEINIVRHPTTGVRCGLWTVEVQTDSRIDTSSSNPADDPTDYRPRRRWYTQKQKERMEVDLNNYIIATTAYEPYNFETDQVNIVLEIERYEEYPTNPATMLDYANSTNDASFYGAPIGTVLLDDIRTEEVTINNVTYIKTTYVFIFRMREDPLYDGIDPEHPTPFSADTIRKVYLLDQGYMYLKTPGDTNSESITYLDAKGHPRLINLDEFGQKLPDGDPPHFTDWDIIRYMDFDALNLEF